MSKVINWNVNSINVRINHLKSIIESFNPEVILLQEIKCIEEKFPLHELEHLGYNIKIHGQKTYNGVAILSKSPIEDVRVDLPQNDNIEARYIEAFTTIKNIPFKIASVYVPNGSEVGSDKFEQKLKFFQSLYIRLNELKEEEENILIAGDFNVAPFDIDVYDPKHLRAGICFNQEEQMWFRKFLNIGYFDSYRIVNPNSAEYSWWDYRKSGWQQNKGMRIDHALLSAKAMDLLNNVSIYSKARQWEKPSDHAPIICSF